MWQGVERKATFIGQLMRGKLDTREIEEIDSAALSAAEAKAISSGNPLLLEHSTIQNEVTRLRRLERAHQRNENMLLHTQREAQRDADRAETAITGLEAALPRITDTSGDRFRIQIQGRSFESRVDAADALARWANSTDMRWANRYANRDYGTVGRLSGFDVTVQLRTGLTGAEVQVGLDGVPHSSFIMTRESFLEGGSGLIQRIENRVSGIPNLLEHARDDHVSARRLVADTEQRIGRPFRYAQALAHAEEDLARVETQLAAMQDGASAPEREAELSIEQVRDYRPTMGIRPSAADEGRAAPQAATTRAAGCRPAAAGTLGG